MIVSMCLPQPADLSPIESGRPTHGETTANSLIFRGLIESETVERLEVFVPPAFMAHPTDLARTAESFLPDWRKGKGALGFFPVNSMEMVWADARPRILYSPDTDDLYRHRLLRDTLATGPVAHVTDTHSNGYHRLFDNLLRMVELAPVPHDSLLAIANVVESTTRDFYAEYAPHRPLPFRVDPCYHGIDTDQFTPASLEERTHLRKIYGIAPEAVVTLFFGRLTPHSKSDLGPILRVFAEVSAPGHILAIGGVEGANGYVDHLSTLARRLGISDRVVFLGEFAPAMRSLAYRIADIFLFPSDTVQEMLGITSLEAQSSGLPVIASDWSGMREGMIAGETGYVVRTRMNPHLGPFEAVASVANLQTHYMTISQNVVIDYPALGEALRKLLGDADLRRRMGETARRNIVANFDAKITNQRRLDIFGELLDLAKNEDPAARGDRRAYARARLPRYPPWFRTYPTGFFNGGEGVTLTAYGRQILDGSVNWEVYDDLAGIQKLPVIDWLLRAVGAGQYASFEEICRNGARHSGLDFDTVAWHLSLLAKQSAILVE